MNLSRSRPSQARSANRVIASRPRADALYAASYDEADDEVIHGRSMGDRCAAAVLVTKRRGVVNRRSLR